MKTGEDLERRRLETLLDGYLTHVPPSINAGSYNLSVMFKVAIASARKTRHKRGVRLGELQSAVNTLHRYWE